MGENNAAMNLYPNRTPVEERYHNDATFHVLVDTFYYHMREAKYTPTELREACHLAACMYEMYHVKPMFVPQQKREPGHAEE